MKSKKEMSVDELAIIINKGFDHVTKDINELKEGQKKLEAGYKKLEEGQKKLEAGVLKLEVGQKEIKQDLTFTARKYELTELKTRVEKLEYTVAKTAK